ncbi:hypothetical protein Q3G72_002354 [Acer saccharum]|nr:hypothetical protein Q3G72_002354 [Acer saccharum]
MLQAEYSEIIEEEFLVSNAELDVWYKREEIRLAQQAKIKWLSEGDQNSKFFDAIIMQRWRNSYVKSMILPDGSSLDNMEMVHNGAVNYFEQFIGINVAVQGADLENVIHTSISEVIVNQLKEKPTEEEVYDVLKSISVDSSPGPDGFGPLFAEFLEGEHSQIRLKDLVIDNVLDDEELQRLLGLEKTDEVIGRVGKFRNSEDVLLWLPEKDGCFNTKSAWYVIRVRLSKFGRAKWIWHKCLPKKIVVCMWKAVFNCLNVDEKRCVIGISDDHVLRNMEVQISLKKQKKIQVLRWLKPALGRLKLNLDGSSLGNPGPAGGGHVLRDSSGNFIFGFSKFFGLCSNNEAELRAVVEGISICKHLGHDGIDIECDYDIVVFWIRSRICNLWYLWDFWDQLIDLLEGFDFSIHHFYGEGNKVADALARYGARGRNNVFSSSSKLPGVIKGFLHLDKLGTAYVRHV